ncbi:MAG: aminoacyl-tRNA hydrolase [Dehalococcoidia bacterium]|nr:aminoacyl-tRNA hydrolase [Dehalococcoidia bacterium]
MSPSKGSGQAAERWLIAGLGNPGPAYAHNRHNVGYWCVNRLARLHGINLKTRRLAALGEGTIGATPVLLLKPRTFVNHSGQAVAAALRHSGIAPERLVVVYDDLDLPAGRLRLKAQGSHGGHNGLRSIIGAIAGSGFPRVRIGIGRPHVAGEPAWDPDVVAGWVLSDPGPVEAKALHEAIGRAAEAIELLLNEGVETAMNRYNR